MSFDRRTMAALACAALVGAGGACRRSSPPGGPAPTGQALASDPRRLIEPAGLVALDKTSAALQLGDSTQTTTDRALSNGNIPLGQQTLLHGDAEARLAISLQGGARLEGNATAGGAITVASGAVITGTRTPNAAVPTREFPSTDELLASLGANFGSSKPDIVVGAGATVNLAAGGAKVSQVVLASSGKLVVNGVSFLQADTVQLGSSSSIQVRASGRLVLLVKRLLQGGSDAGIVQDAPGQGRGLIVALAPGAFAQMGPLAHFGPGLIYGHDVTGAAPPRFEIASGNLSGALAVDQINSASSSQMVLSSRYLACASPFTDPLTVTLLRPTAAERQPPPGSSSIAVEGTVAPLSIFARATISDAVQQRSLAVDGAGHFLTTATLRSDGTATSICVVARDCLDRDVTACTLVAPQAPLDIAFTSPSPGQIVSVGTLNITGRITGGPISKIAVGSQTGSFLGNAFTIPGVTLAAGVNVLVVEATTPGGQKVQRRLVVSRGAMSVVDLALTLDPARNVTVTKKSTRASVPFALAEVGAMSYRLLDGNGVELHRGRIPGTDRIVAKAITDAGTFASAEPQIPQQAQVTVPAVPGAVRVEFMDESGLPVGTSAL